MSGGFVKVPNDVARCKDLDPYTFRVYVVLASRIGPQGWTMTLKVLAEECAMSTKQVSRILPKLRELFGLCYQSCRNGGYQFGWTSSPSEATTSPTGETASPGGETRSPITNATDETHSPLREDSQSAPVRLTVLSTGTPLKEPKNHRLTTMSKRAISPELQEAIDTWTTEGLGKLSMKATTGIKVLIATYGLPMVVRGIQTASRQSIKWPVSWMESTLPAWKREDEANGSQGNGRAFGRVNPQTPGRPGNNARGLLGGITQAEADARLAKYQ